MNRTDFTIVDECLRGAESCPSPNYNERPAGCGIDLLVLHNISLPPGRFGTGCIQRFFQNRLEVAADPFFREIAALQVSAHLLIDRQGVVTQFVPFNLRAWHAGVSCYDGRQQCNDFSIGIELEGTDELPYSDPQYDVLVAVCDALLKHYPALSPERIVGHCDIAPGRKTDPGPAFDWSRFRTGLERCRQRHR